MKYILQGSPKLWLQSELSAAVFVEVEPSEGLEGRVGGEGNVGLCCGEGGGPVARCEHSHVNVNTVIAHTLQIN